MSIVDKLVYLVKQGTITIERVSTQYRAEVAAATEETPHEV